MRAKCCVWVGCLGLVLLAGCSEKKYADAKQVNEEYISAAETYVAAMEKVDSAQTAAKAMNAFADEMERLLPKMKAVAEKYPELKDGDQVPEELKGLAQRAEQVGQKMGSVMMNIMPYMQDPEIQKAQMRFQQAMQGSAQ